MERTDEEKICSAPITVSLGGKDYQIRQLTIVEAREWKKEFAKLLTDSFSKIKVNSSDEEKFESGVLSILVDSPDLMIDLFFSYAKELNREEIENSATESELIIAWEEVQRVAFPLARNLLKTLSQTLP